MVGRKVFENFISFKLKDIVFCAVKCSEKCILPLYAGKERTLAFFGHNVTSLYLIKWKRVITKIEIRSQKHELILPLYARNKRG